MEVGFGRPRKLAGLGRRSGRSWACRPPRFTRSAAWASRGVGIEHETLRGRRRTVDSAAKFAILLQLQSPLNREFVPVGVEVPLTFSSSSGHRRSSGSILANGGTTADILSLVKTDAGTWVLGGANTYTGTTTVLAGTLLVNGDQSAATGAISVATSAVLGGSGTMGGNAAFGSGALFAFNAAAPLTVSGSVTFASAATFGVGSLTGLTSSVADATYPLIAGNVDVTGLANFGSSNAYDLGSGKAAYFESLSPSGLSLVVVPEPTSIAGGLAAFGVAAFMLRRRRRD
jgi:autotransporter-associated beta strand protein